MGKNKVLGFYTAGVDPYYGEYHVEGDLISVYVYKLPSEHQVDDVVDVSFGSTGFIKECRVIKVHFSDSKVLYDVSVPVVCENLEGNTNTSFTRIYNIDSAFVTKHN